MNKKYFIPILGALIIIFAVYLNQQAKNSPIYSGLPTVACLDSTEKIVKNYTFNLEILILNKKTPIESKIGYDYGQCLHSIYTNDSSGKVFVKENDSTPYTLGNFFDVWHKTFNDNQIFNYQTDNKYKLKVIINDKEFTQNLRNIKLLPNEDIKIIYN